MFVHQESRVFFAPAFFSGHQNTHIPFLSLSGQQNTSTIKTPDALLNGIGSIGRSQRTLLCETSGSRSFYVMINSDGDNAEAAGTGG